MKVISWNLKNISANKLGNTFQPKFASSGYGNNVLDYIVNVVMGAPEWYGNQVAPVDVFVIIELKTGGYQKGTAVSGQCKPTLMQIRNALNNYIATNLPSSKYSYEVVQPLVTGRHETVGFIYNTKVFKFVKVAVEKDAVSDTYFPGRTPLVSTFSLVSNSGKTVRFSGIHDQPPAGGAAVRMRIPINYCARLVNTPSAKQPNTFFLGDFNCQPTDYYLNGNGVRVYPFPKLRALGYFTQVPNNSLSSVRRRIAKGQYGVERYLNAAYDNIIYWTPGALPKSGFVFDLIGTSLDRNNEVAALNAYNVVSDHLPVIMEY